MPFAKVHCCPLALRRSLGRPPKSANGVIPYEFIGASVQSLIDSYSKANHARHQQLSAAVDTSRNSHSFTHDPIDCEQFKAKWHRVDAH